MAKPTLIKLEFVQIPAAHFGAFWMFCQEHPGIQFKHQEPAAPQALVEGMKHAMKRKVGKMAEGTTGRCIVLRALNESRSALTTKHLTGLLVAAGKSAKSIAGVVHTLRKEKHVRSISIPAKGDQPTAHGWKITATGTEYYTKNCDGK